MLSFKGILRTIVINGIYSSDELRTSWTCLSPIPFFWFKWDTTRIPRNIEAKGISCRSRVWRSIYCIFVYLLFAFCNKHHWQFFLWYCFYCKACFSVVVFWFPNPFHSGDMKCLPSTQGKWKSKDSRHSVRKTSEHWLSFKANIFSTLSELFSCVACAL